MEMGQGTDKDEKGKKGGCTMTIKQSLHSLQMWGEGMHWCDVCIKQPAFGHVDL